MYASYPTAHLQEADRISLVASVEQIRILWQSELNTYGHDMFLTAADVTGLLGWLVGAGEVTIAAVFAQFSGFDKPRLWRTLGWLQKLGIIKNSPCQVRG